MKLYSKRFFIIVLFYFIVSCENNQFLNSEYDYPIDSIKGTTVFKWKNFHGDSLFTTHTYQTLDFTAEDTLLIIYSYNSNNLTDSSIFLVRNKKNKLLEQWLFLDDDYGDIITMKSKRISRTNDFQRIVYNSFFLPLFLNSVERTTSKFDTLETGQLSIISNNELSLRLKLLNIKVFGMAEESMSIKEKHIGTVEFKSMLEDKPFHSFLDTIYHKY